MNICTISVSFVKNMIKIEKMNVRFKNIQEKCFSFLVLYESQKDKFLMHSVGKNSIILLYYIYIYIYIILFYRKFVFVFVFLSFL
jgi:hypothetical protein